MLLLDHDELKVNQLQRLCSISRETIVLETKLGRITIIGSDLMITEYRSDEIIINGHFDRVEFAYA